MPDLDNTWFNNWPDGLIGLDKDNRIVELSPVARAIIGWTQRELYGADPHDALCAQEGAFAHKASDCPLLRLADPQETISTLWKHRNGHHVSVDFRVIPVGYGKASHVVSLLDNSTRLHNQAEMEKFSQYVEMSPAPMAEFVMDGQLLFGNTALQELLLEYGFDKNGTANALPHNIRAIGAKLKHSDSAYDIVEVKLENRYFVWHFHILDNDGSPTMVGYAFDITAQKEAENVAAEQRAQMRKEFYAKMVHELRTPLNAIVGLSDLLLHSLQNSVTPRQAQQLQLIKDAGVQLNEQVTATLDIAKIESGKMSLDISSFSLEDVCREIQDQLKTLAQDKGLVFEMAVWAEHTIFSDRTKVRQIITNLVSNAIKYTQEGSVHLLVSEAEDRDIGNCICISVSDTGIGIEEDQIPKLFTSFEQIKEDRNRDIEGTGLGLSLVHNLVKLLGGTIKVDSTYGVGSNFEVLLPFAENKEI